MGVFVSAIGLSEVLRGVLGLTADIPHPVVIAANRHPFCAVPSSSVGGCSIGWSPYVGTALAERDAIVASAALGLLCG
jgi:hypothetical protein